MFMGTLLSGAFVYGNFGYLVSVHRPAELRHFAVLLLFGLFCVSLIVAGIGVLGGRTWAWWLSGFLTAIALVRLSLSTGSWLLHTRPAHPVTTESLILWLLPISSLAFAALPLLAWQARELRVWCSVRTPLLHAVGLIAAFASAAYVLLLVLVFVGRRP